MENIEKNLYQFYHQLGMTDSVTDIQLNGYDVVVSEDGFWPQIIFNLDNSIEPEKLISKISADFSEKQYTSFFIASDKFITRKHQPVLKDNKIIPVKLLRGMNLFSEKKCELEIPSGTQIIELQEDSQFLNFLNLVNSELMASEALFSPKLLNYLKLCDDIKIFGLFSSRNLASTLLVYTDQGIAGLYFIATKKEFRNKGYASVLIKFVINNLIESGVKEVVLHANNFAAEIYNKLGFEHKNNFIIYKIL